MAHTQFFEDFMAAGGAPLVGEGFIVANLTFFNEDGSINFDIIPSYVDFLQKQGASGVLVNGTTAEGSSLSGVERKAVFEAYSKVVEPPFLLMAHVGHDSVEESIELTRHAVEHGAHAIASLTPSYFNPSSADDIVRCLAPVAAAGGSLPFYYYHIPGNTKCGVAPSKVLAALSTAVPTLRGLKFSDQNMVELRRCVELCESHSDAGWEVLFGSDAAFPSAWAMGVRGAVGSTYHYSISEFRKAMTEMHAGSLDAGPRLASWSIQVQDALRIAGSNQYHSALKLIVREQMKHPELSTACRAPLPSLTPEEEEKTLKALHDIELLAKE